YKGAAAKLEARMLAELRAADLAGAKRIVFYPLGAATALLLDTARPGWRERYLQQLSLETLMTSPAQPCAAAPEVRPAPTRVGQRAARQSGQGGTARPAARPLAPLAVRAARTR